MKVTLQDFEKEDISEAEANAYYNDFLKTLDGERTRRVLDELRIYMFLYKLNKDKDSPLVHILFRSLAAKGPLGQDGLPAYQMALDYCNNPNFLGASKIECALMFDRYCNKKEACSFLDISLYEYNTKYASLLDNKYAVYHTLKTMKPKFNDSMYITFCNIVSFINNFVYLPRKYGYKFINEERGLELEFAMITDNLVDCFGERFAFYIFTEIISMFGFKTNTLLRLWENRPYLIRKVPRTTGSTCLYIWDKIAYGFHRGLKKSEICRYLLRKPQSYIQCPNTRKVIKETDWEGYMDFMGKTTDWSTLSKDEVEKFIRIFEEVANFLNG